MKLISIYQTKAKLSQVIKMVRSGQEFIITDRGTPVARICPLAEKNDLMSKLEALQNQGLLEQRSHSDYGSLPISKSGVVERFLKDRE